MLPDADNSGRGEVPQAGFGFDEIRRKVGLLLGPALFVLVLALPLSGVSGLSVPAHRLAAVLALVITFWVTEALPLPVTALAGPMLAVILGVSGASDTFAPFADPLIFLFMGSFMLARAIFVHRLNERIAYGVMSWKVIGARPRRILIAYGVIAALISAWMSNTATAAMLLPVGMSLLAFMEAEKGIDHRYGAALMLTMAYGSSLGGMATIVGTPPNVIAVGMLRDYVGVEISFVEWLLFAAPASLVMVGFLVFYMGRISGAGTGEIPGADRIIIERRSALGPWRRGEKNVLFAFLVTVTLWVVPGLVSLSLGEDHPAASTLSDAVPISVAALIGVVILFLLPIDRERRATLTWREAVGIDWGTILLFGGGLSLGQMAFSTGLAEAFGRIVTAAVPVDSVAWLTFAAAVFATVFSETMSNTAAANIAIPIVISIAMGMGVDPVPPAIAASLASSVAVILPVSTPANAIVYASGKVPITRMVRYGLVMDLVAITVIPLIVLIVL
jgi:sodium-dependent dicarboxylate transporter 2/3/5